MPAPDVVTELLSQATEPQQGLLKSFPKCVPSQITQPCCAAASLSRSTDNKVKLSAAGALEAADAAMFKPAEQNVLFLQKGETARILLTENPSQILLFPKAILSLTSLPV